MRKFQRKPAIVEAVQFNGHNQHEISEFVSGMLLVVPFGYWVVRGGRGDVYPCSPEVFDATYQPIAGGPEEGSQADDMGKPPEAMHHPEVGWKAVPGPYQAIDLATPDTVRETATWACEPSDTPPTTDHGETLFESPTPDSSEPASQIEPSV